MMLKTLKDLFDGLLQPAACLQPQDEQHRLQLATAVLLVEVMRGDPGFDPGKRAAVVTSLRDAFTLADDETERLMELARHPPREASDCYVFPARVDAGFAPDQKLRMVEHMWQAADGDGLLVAHEEQLLRQIAELLHIPDGAYVSVRQQALAGPDRRAA
jgi:uncharacterized tellurite resistance protein B-like protein